MSTPELAVLVVLAALAVLVASGLLHSARRLRHPRTGGRHAGGGTAEAQQPRELDLRPLPSAERVSLSDRWEAAYEDFVDHPVRAAREACRVVEEVMARCACRTEDVDRVGLGEERREAERIAELNERGQATTEQLRQAMVHTRTLLSELFDQAPEHEDVGFAPPVLDLRPRLG